MHQRMRSGMRNVTVLIKLRSKKKI